jgi:hypothetical protein
MYINTHIQAEMEKRRGAFKRWQRAQLIQTQGDSIRKNNYVIVSFDKDFCLSGKNSATSSIFIFV